VVSTNSEIKRTSAFFAVAVTGEFGDPLLDCEIPLPWNRSGHCKSGLTKECVANCSWMRQLLLTDVIEIKGHLRGEELDRVVKQAGMA
jgi:hypothetical protein